MNGQPVAAAQIIIAVVPIVGIVMAGVLIFSICFGEINRLSAKFKPKPMLPYNLIYPVFALFQEFCSL